MRKYIIVMDTSIKTYCFEVRWEPSSSMLRLCASCGAALVAAAHRYFPRLLLSWHSEMRYSTWGPNKYWSLRGFDQETCATMKLLGLVQRVHYAVFYSAQLWVSDLKPKSRPPTFRSGYEGHASVFFRENGLGWFFRAQYVWRKKFFFLWWNAFQTFSCSTRTSVHPSPEGYINWLIGNRTASIAAICRERIS